MYTHVRVKNLFLLVHIEKPLGTGTFSVLVTNRELHTRPLGPKDTRDFSYVKGIIVFP